MLDGHQRLAWIQKQTCSTRNTFHHLWFLIDNWEKGISHAIVYISGPVVDTLAIARHILDNLDKGIDISMFQK